MLIFSRYAYSNFALTSGGCGGSTSELREVLKLEGSERQRDPETGNVSAAHTSH